MWKENRMGIYEASSSEWVTIGILYFIIIFQSVSQTFIFFFSFSNFLMCAYCIRVSWWKEKKKKVLFFLPRNWKHFMGWTYWWGFQPHYAIPRHQNNLGPIQIFSATHEICQVPQRTVRTACLLNTHLHSNMVFHLLILFATDGFIMCI